MLSIEQSHHEREHQSWTSAVSPASTRNATVIHSAVQHECHVRAIAPRTIARSVSCFGRAHKFHAIPTRTSAAGEQHVQVTIFNAKRRVSDEHKLLANTNAAQSVCRFFPTRYILAQCISIHLRLQSCIRHQQSLPSSKPRPVLS